MRTVGTLHLSWDTPFDRSDFTQPIGVLLEERSERTQETSFVYRSMIILLESRINVLVMNTTLGC